MAVVGDGLAGLATADALLERRSGQRRLLLEKEDDVARHQSGHERIVPFRGESYFLRPHRRDLVRGLIYPVPDPALPSLGVHFTRTVHGELEAGPTAVLALAREGYHATMLRPRDLAETFAYPGFWRLAGRLWRLAAYASYRSWSTPASVA